MLYKHTVVIHYGQRSETLTTGKSDASNYKMSRHLKIAFETVMSASSLKAPPTEGRHTYSFPEQWRSNSSPGGENLAKTLILEMYGDSNSCCQPEFFPRDPSEWKSAWIYYTTSYVCRCISLKKGRRLEVIWWRELWLIPQHFRAFWDGYNRTGFIVTFKSGGLFIHVCQPRPSKKAFFSPKCLFDVGISIVLKHSEGIWDPVLLKISQLVVK